MEKIVNNDGYLRSGLMDIARQLLNICSETGVSNIQIVTSPWKESEGITLLAKNWRQTNSFSKDGYCL